jgi:hypothetical protein
MKTVLIYSQPETAREPAIISRSDGATQAQIGAVFFRVPMRFLVIDSNHARAERETPHDDLALVVLYRS